MDVYTMARNMGPDYSPISPVRSDARVLLYNEDSGYHTSFTPGSIDCSEVSNENLDPKYYDSLLNSKARLHACVSPRKSQTRINSGLVSPQSSVPSSPKRGRKRRADENSLVIYSVPTPTSYITNGIQKLHMNDASDLPIPTHNFSLGEHSEVLSYPTTPVKRICRLNVTRYSPISSSQCVKSSPNKLLITSTATKRPKKKLDFSAQSKTANNANVNIPVKSSVRPHQKFDIVGLLYKRQLPFVNDLLSYLDNKDTYTFSLVSPLWYQACVKASKANNKRKEYLKFMNITKENIECREKVKLCGEPKKKGHGSTLKDNNTLLNVQYQPVRSPPGTPRTNKFKKFTKSASLDARAQLPCVRCSQPAKVTLECTGEEWAECSNFSCSFQFCKKCHCRRHPLNNCSPYDLEAPSPSKRLTTTSTIGTRNSKRNLRRL